ncbi:MAG: hypothetical protein ACI90V_012892, partial [Bacillariaceae sp.]
MPDNTFTFGNYRYFPFPCCNSTAQQWEQIY